MTSRDFVIWFKGFITACNDYQPTPKQWDYVKEVLNTVEELKDFSYINNMINLPDSINSTAKTLLKD